MRKGLIITLISLLSLPFILFSQPAMAEATTVNSNSIVVQSIPGPTLAQKVVERTQSSWSWYIIRGSGIIAAAALIILMLSGIGLVTGHTFKFMEPLTAWASHRALGIVMGVSILLHMFGLLFDHFIPFNLVSLFIPWASNFKPVSMFGIQFGSLYVALGILAFYGTLLVILTSLIWVEKRQYLWKFVHLLSYIVMGFVFFHTLYLGTDFTHGITRWLWTMVGISIAAVGIYRLWRSRSI